MQDSGKAGSSRREDCSKKKQGGRGLGKREVGAVRGPLLGSQLHLATSCLRLCARTQEVTGIGTLLRCCAGHRPATQPTRGHAQPSPASTTQQLQQTLSKSVARLNLGLNSSRMKWGAQAIAYPP